MDILNLIKSEHDRLRKKIASILEEAQVSGKKLDLDSFTKEVSTHFRIEREYIYPEAQTLFPVSSWIKSKQASQDYIIDQLKKLLESTSDIDSTGIKDLMKKIEDHFVGEEDLLMPKFRSLWSFDQREEFGQAVEDYQQELLASM